MKRISIKIFISYVSLRISKHHIYLIHEFYKIIVIKFTLLLYISNIDLDDVSAA